MPCFVCAVQSAVAMLVQSKPYFQSRGQLQHCTPLLYEVSWCFSNGQPNTRQMKRIEFIPIGCPCIQVLLPELAQTKWKGASGISLFSQLGHRPPRGFLSARSHFLGLLICSGSCFMLINMYYVLIKCTFLISNQMYSIGNAAFLVSNRQNTSLLMRWCRWKTLG